MRRSSPWMASLVLTFTSSKPPGRRVRTAVASAREALRAFQGEAPDVLVTDIGLPDEDGYMLLRQLRQQQAGHAGTGGEEREAWEEVRNG